MKPFQKKRSPFSPSEFFPDAVEADEHGLLSIGGMLTPEWLLDAYSHGIFPWPFQTWRSREHLLGWFSLDPRCIFEFDRFHVPKRLARTCRNSPYRISSNVDFRGVIQGCADPENRDEGTWITPAMIDAYIDFHEAGFAHSVEAWKDEELVGGVYGIAIGGLFAAESMFYRATDASKVALVALIRHLRRQGFTLVDIQVVTDHTERFGAVEIPRAEYLERLHEALQLPVRFGKIDPETVFDEKTSPML